MKEEVFQVVGRDVKLQACWLRVKTGRGWKILTMPDGTIPHGMKTATHLLVRWNGKVRTTDAGYQADLEVLEDVSGEEGAGTPQS